MNGETAADRHVHPATVPLRLVKEAPSTLLGLPAAFAYVSDVGWATVLGFAGGVAALAILMNWIAWKRFRYGIGADEIVIESGILQRNRRLIPFARVQDVDIERGPLQRLFGLAKVRIETGGGARDEGVLDSVSAGEADRIRAAVRAARAAGVDSEAAEPERRLVYAMQTKDLLASGLFGFSLLYIAALFAFLQSFADYLPFDIYDPGRWMGLVDEQRKNGYFAPGAILALLAVALLLGVVTGIARVVARDYGFRLTIEEGTRFRRERGLFTRTEMVVPKDRLQLALARAGPLRRLVGRTALSFQTLSADRQGSGQQSVAPWAGAAEAKTVLAEAGLRLPPTGEMRMVSRRHVLRVIAWDLLPVPVILVAALFWPPALLSLALLPPLIAKGLIERRFHRYALADGLLFVEAGLWRQRLWIVPARRVQALRITRGPLQRGLRLATLWIDTAGGAALGGPRIVDLAEEEACRLAARLRSTTQLSGRKSGTDR